MVNSYKIPDVNCRNGAPMGRPQHHNEAMAEAPIRFHLRHLRLDSGGYDEGGAYWGLRQRRNHVRPDGHIVRVMPRLFWYFNHEHDIAAIIEAVNRDDAKARIKAHYYPNATFFN